MSTSPDTQNSSEIRNNIDQTRDNMDSTIDALATRFQGRHLFDEVVGFIRSSSDTASERASEIKDRVFEAASKTASAVADTVKRNPVPAALIGAGAAYLIYRSIKSSSQSDSTDVYSVENYDIDAPGYELSGEEYLPVDLDEYASRQAEDSPAARLHRTLSQAKSTLNNRTEGAAGKLRSAAQRVGEKVREGTESVRQRASDISGRVQETTRKAYVQSRDQVVSTVQQHPVEVGLGLLAAGLLVGMALPSPRRVTQAVAPQADRLRRRARELGQELVDRSRHVARAAADAARKEAQAQGLTPGDGSSGQTGSVGFASAPQPGQPAVDGLQSSSAAEI